MLMWRHLRQAESNNPSKKSPRSNISQGLPAPQIDRAGASLAGAFLGCPSLLVAHIGNTTVLFIKGNWGE